MTVRKCFNFGITSDVTHLIVVLVLISILDSVCFKCSGEAQDRDSRKLFGGYKITPAYCKASRAAKYNKGNTICMFNHECVQRGGEVVGACMDGFLFGACCQLKSDSQSHIPKGPGVVMTSYLDYPDAEAETDDYGVEAINAWHNSFKPVITPGYRPGEKTQSTPSSTPKTIDKVTEAGQSELISEGFNQITNSLLESPPKEESFMYLKPGKPDNHYSHSSIYHSPAETILLHKNGSAVENVVRPSDFSVQISHMQTKPTVSPLSTLPSSPPKTVSTHRPLLKPIFKPNSTIKISSTTPRPVTDSFVFVPTVTKESSKVTELTSINSILVMSNDSTPTMKDELTSPASFDVETKSSPSPTGTVSPVSYSSGYPSTNVYVTPRPSSYKPFQSSTVIASSKPATKKPVYVTKKPQYSTANTIQSSRPTSPKPNKSTTYSSPRPSQSTSQAIEAFNRYPTNPSDFSDSVTTFSYVSSTTTKAPTTTTRKPPSTSYVTGSQPLRRPVTPPTDFASTYDLAPDTFSSVTPTVIVLNGFQTSKPETSAEEPQFVEISQEPFKKPVSQITVNNHIQSTNNIYMGKPPQSPDRPSSPTVVITPKPAPATTPYPNKQRPATISVSTVSNVESFSDYYSPTTITPVSQTSPDDLINFPPVRNPLLNATGSNPEVFNTSIALADNEIDVLPDVDFTTPVWQEDEKLKEKMNLFVNKIVGSLQGTFQELHDIVTLDKKPNSTIVSKTTTAKPIKKPATTKKPAVTTKKPLRLTTTTSTTTKKPVRSTTKKPAKLTTAARRPTTTTAAPTTTVEVTTAAPTRKPVTKRPKPATTTAVSTTTVQYEEVTTEPYVNEDIDFTDKNLCGVRPLVKSGRIVGGKNAKFGAWPWQVLVRESTWLGLFVKNKCGGVLITNRFVTTAAHCQPGFLASLVAVFGENDISGDFEPMKPVTKNVRRVIVHRQYDARTFENDLALLELDSPVTYDRHIVPICMPPDEADFTGRMATVTGWGRLKYAGGVPAVLQEVQVPVIDNSACQEMFKTGGHSKTILRSFICAGYANGKKDSCEGDSGGPLVLQRPDGRWQLIGTVSHGIKCAAPYLPGVYMRTTFYKPWLKSITGVKL